MCVPTFSLQRFSISTIRSTIAFIFVCVHVCCALSDDGSGGRSFSPQSADDPSSATKAESAENLLLQGEAKYRQREYREALLCFEQCAALHQDNETTAVWYLTRTHLSLGNQDAAFKALQTLVALDGTSARTLATQGAAELSRREWRAATEFAKRTLAVDPDFGYGHYVMAHSLAQQDRFEETLAHLDFALKAQPDEFEVKPAHIHLLRAVSLNTLHRPRYAILAVRDALQLEPDNIKALSLKAEYQIRDGYVDEAVTTVNRMLQLQPENRQILRIAAAAHEHCGNLEQAVVYCRQAIDLNPQAVEEWITLARLLRKSDAGNEALDAINEALRLEPENIEARCGLVYILSGEPRPLNPVRGLEIARKLPETGPGVSECNFARALAYAAVGQLRLADQHLTAALSDPDATDRVLALARANQNSIEFRRRLEQELPTPQPQQ